MDERRKRKSRQKKRRGGRRPVGRRSAGAHPPPVLRLLQGGNQPARGKLKARPRLTLLTRRILRLENVDTHGAAFVVLDGERPRWPARPGHRGRQPGRLKTAAPHALTKRPARPKAQKGRVRRRRPKDKSKIK